MYACGGEPETRKHCFHHCPHYAIPRAALFSSLRLKSPSLAYPLSDPRGTKATLRFLANSGRFDLLYSPPSEDPPVYFLIFFAFVIVVLAAAVARAFVRKLRAIRLRSDRGLTSSSSKSRAF